MTNKESLTTLCLGGFKNDNVSEVKWALENFADAVGIKIYSGIKHSYDCERESYTLSFRFFKDRVDEILARPEQEPLSDYILSKEIDIIKKDSDFSNVRPWQIYYLARRIEELHGIGGSDEY